MNKNIIIINNFNKTDRVTEVIIFGSKYIIFTLYHINLIVIEFTNKEKPILLLNRNYSSYDALLDKFNKLINSAVIGSYDFISNMDTYIDLSSTVHNETTNEIMHAYNIILKDYNL